MVVLPRRQLRDNVRLRVGLNTLPPQFAEQPSSVLLLLRRLGRVQNGDAHLVGAGNEFPNVGHHCRRWLVVGSVCGDEVVLHVVDQEGRAIGMKCPVDSGFCREGGDAVRRDGWDCH